MTVVRQPTAITDVRLSLAARGLFAWVMAQHGAVPDEALLGAATDADEIHAALGELVLLGYVEVEP